MRISHSVLEDIEALENRVGQLKFELELLEENRTFIKSKRLDGVSAAAAPGAASYEKICDKTVDLKREIEAAILELSQRRHELIALIQRVDDIVLSKILFLRYVKRMQLADIGAELGYSGNYVYHLHTKALDALDVMMANLS